MSSSVGSYTIQELPADNLVTQLTQRNHWFDILNDDFLDTRRYAGEAISVEAYFEGLYGDDLEPPSTLHASLTQHLIQFLTQHSLIDKVSNLNFDITEAQLEAIIKLRNVLGEQLYYLEEDKCDKDRRFVCQAYLSDLFLGEVFAFYDPVTKPEWMVIQGICQSLEVGLCLILFPELHVHLPRLNHILNAAIEELARRLGVTSILVYPLKKQGEILQKYYGYKVTDILYYPCDFILGGKANPIDVKPGIRLIKTLVA